MNKLHIALQDGFQADSVTISVDGRKVFDKQRVTTNLAISYADAVEVPVSNQTATVEVNVSSRNSSARLNVNVLENPYLSVNLTEEGAPRLTPSKEMFHYM